MKAILTTTYKVHKNHPYAWLWEPLESDPGFALRSMFGCKVACLDDKLYLYFIHREKSWQGVLICTSHEHHASLIADFPVLAPHSVLGKWLYLPETEDTFEKVAQKLVTLVRKRDPRLGVISSASRARTSPRGESPGRTRRGRRKA